MLADRIRSWWADVREPGWARPGPTRAQRRIDIALVGVFLLVGAISAVLLDSLGPAVGLSTMGWQQQAMWLLLLGVPMIWRRRYPCAVAVVVATVFLIAQYRGFPDQTTESVVLFWALYSCGAWAQHRLAAFWTRVTVIVAMFVAIGINAFGMDRSELGITESGLLAPFLAGVLYNLLLNTGYFAGSVFFGTAAWVSARRRAQLERQALVLAAAQEREAQRAVVNERVRIARELHDVVAHHVSVMGVQASAARRVLGRSPELAVDALTAVEQTARVAIADLRGLLGVLRAAGAAEDPAMEENFTAAPGIDQIPDLVEQSRSAGLAIDLAVFGAPRAVPAAVSLCAFRVVQEALTNVIKHARASSVDVRVRYSDASLEVEVTDDGSGWQHGPGSAGYGLVGMRERVAVHGGELELGPRANGFRVRARLPLPTAGAADDLPADTAQHDVEASQGLSR